MMKNGCVPDQKEYLFQPKTFAFSYQILCYAALTEGRQRIRGESMRERTSFLEK
jgi:hypothetical protein